MAVAPRLSCRPVGDATRGMPEGPSDWCLVIHERRFINEIRSRRENTAVRVMRLRLLALHAPRHRSMFTLLFSLLATVNATRHAAGRALATRTTFVNELQTVKSLHTDRGPQPRRVHTPRRGVRAGAPASRLASHILYLMHTTYSPTKSSKSVVCPVLEDHPVRAPRSRCTSANACARPRLTRGSACGSCCPRRPVPFRAPTRWLTP